MPGPSARPLRTLVLNAGSSSLKVSLVDADDRVLEHETITGWDGDAGSVTLPDWEHDVIGHRVVHGGSTFTGPAWLDEQVRQRIDELTSLAPLHQPRSCAGIDAAANAFPASSALAAFDTSFHADLPPAARTYAVPRDWPVRRFGAHGLSHAYVARRTAELLQQDPGELRAVTCHLGSGGSLCAVDGGRSVDTTMGMTPLEGLVMSTRSGTIDPGIVLWMQRHHGLTAEEVQRALEHDSGLLALAGEPDMEVVTTRAEGGDDDAILALDVYVHTVAKGIAAMTAVLGGLDAITFTGGVGEHSPLVRSRVAAALAWMDVRIDEDRNGQCMGDEVLTAHGCSLSCAVVTAQEDVEVARQGRQTIGPRPTGPDQGPSSTPTPSVPVSRAGRR